MAYKSEADQWRELFEQQQAINVTNAVKVADLYEWNARLATETLQIRETNRLLRNENEALRMTFYGIAWLVIVATIWNVN